MSIHCSTTAGENLTVDGTPDADGTGGIGDVGIGDQYRVGGATVVVTEPRMRCLKLPLRLNTSDMVQRFLDSQRMGFYVGVVQEGAIRAGDTMECVKRHPDRLTIADVTRLYTTEKDNAELLRRAVGVMALPESWRLKFQRQLESICP